MNQKITIVQPKFEWSTDFDPPGFELGSTRTERIRLGSKWTWSWQTFKHRRHDVFHKEGDVSNMICDILYGVPDTSYHRHFIFVWYFIPKGKNVTSYQSLHPCALHSKRYFIPWHFIPVHFIPSALHTKCTSYQIHFIPSPFMPSDEVYGRDRIVCGPFEIMSHKGDFKYTVLP